MVSFKCKEPVLNVEEEKWAGEVKEINPRDSRHSWGWGGTGEEKTSPRNSEHWTTKAGLVKDCWKEPLEGTTSRDGPH